eukprot:15215935-Ditylum_brightwellii.AAC.1
MEWERVTVLAARMDLVGGLAVGLGVMKRWWISAVQSRAAESWARKQVASQRTCPLAGFPAQFQYQRAWRRGRMASWLVMEGVGSVLSSLGLAVESMRRSRSVAAARTATKMALNDVTSASPMTFVTQG